MKHSIQETAYYGYIYIIWNQYENKCYVGQSTRFNEINYYGSGIIISRIINKYGTYFLNKIILGYCYSEEELNEAEEECIYFFRAYGADGENHDHIYGYNLSPKALGFTKLCPESLEKRIESFKTTLQNNPDITINKEIKRAETLKNDPSIIKDSINKGLITKKNNPEIEIRRVEKLKETCSNRTEDKKLNMHNKMSNSRIIKKQIGNKVNNFKVLNFSLIINLYFDNIITSSMVSSYIDLTGQTIDPYSIYSVLNILEFPHGGKSHKNQEIKTHFIEENKHKINWYIENYERLEEEYYNKKWEKKHGCKIVES